MWNFYETRILSKRNEQKKNKEEDEKHTDKYHFIVF